MQDIFDKVVNHLLTQQSQSVGVAFIYGNGHCLYRGPDGTKCAVGALISDEHYNYALEGILAGDPPVKNAVEKSIGRELTMDELVLLSDLQYIHDDTPVEEWEQSLREEADKWNLNFNYT